MDDSKLNRDAMVVAAFAAEAVTELAVALVRAGSIPQRVALELADLAEQRSKGAGEDHGAQLMRLSAKLSSVIPDLKPGRF